MGRVGVAFTPVLFLVFDEVMVEDLDRAWWAHYRQELSQRFGQQELVVRT